MATTGVVERAASPTRPDIDPTREYGSTAAARFFGVDPAQPRRWAVRGRIVATSMHPFRVSGAELIRYREVRSRVTIHPGVIVMARSLNAKLGRAAATYVARQSCPTSCPFQSQGCYAEHDNTRVHWDRITAGSTGVTPLELAGREARLIDELPGDRDLRLHVAGDSTTVGGTLAIARACRRYMARGRRLGLDVRVWAYTHAWREVPRSAWGIVSVLASCETKSDVQRARSLGYATALVVAEFPGESAFSTDAGRVIPCPQQTRGSTCTDCRLCMDADRLHASDLSVGFALHGWGSNKAAKALASTVRRSLL